MSDKKNRRSDIGDYAWNLQPSAIAAADELAASPHEEEQKKTTAFHPEKLPWPAKPFRGIEPFRLLDWRIFLEREREVEQLQHLVVMYRGVLVFGRSGAGKSSLLNAGLLPIALRRGWAPERIRVLPNEEKPISIERIALREETSPSARTRARRSEASLLAEDLFAVVTRIPREALDKLPTKGETDRRLPKWGNGGADGEHEEATTQRFLPSRFIEGDGAEGVQLSTVDFREKLLARSELGEPLLIFDQFEELITLFEEGSQKSDSFLKAMRARDAIEDLLYELLVEEERSVKVVFAFRDDYLARLTPLFERVPYLLDQNLRLSSPELNHLPRIALGPFTNLHAELARRRHILESEECADPTETDRKAAELNQLAQQETALKQAELTAELATHMQEGFHRLNPSGKLPLTEVQSLCMALWAEPSLRRRFDQALPDSVIRQILEEEAWGKLKGFPIWERMHALTLLTCLVTQEGTRNVLPKTTLIAEARRNPATRIFPASTEKVLEQMPVRTGLVRSSASSNVIYYEMTSEFLIPWVQEALKAVSWYRKAFVWSILGVGVATMVYLAFLLKETENAKAEKEETIRALRDADRINVETKARLSEFTVSLQKAQAETTKYIVQQAEADKVRAEESRKTVEKQKANVEASKLALRLADELSKKLTTKLSTQERELFADTLTKMRTALATAESGEQATTALAEKSEQAAQNIVSAPRLIAVLTGHDKPITALAFSPGAATPGFLATAGADKFVRLWKRTGERMSSVKGSSSDGVKAVAFSDDGMQLVIGSNGSSVRVRNLATGQDYEYQGHKDTITSVSFNNDGSQVLSSSGDRSVQVWSTNQGVLADKRNFKSIVTWASFDAECTRVLASLDDPDNSAALWTVGSANSPVFLKMGAPVKRAVFNPIGDLAVTAGSGDKTAAVWETDTGKRRYLLTEHTAPVLQAIFNPGGDKIATASADKTVRLWNVGDGRPAGVLEGHLAEVTQVTFSPNGLLLLSGSNDGTARLWMPGKSAAHVLGGHNGPLTAVAFSADGTRIATGGSDGTVRLWEIDPQSAIAPKAAFPTGWAHYGNLDRAGSTTFRFRSFSRLEDDAKALPRPGDIVKPLADMNVRDAVSLGSDRKWDQGKPIGLARKDSLAKVLEVIGIEEHDDASNVWIKIEPVAAP